MSLLDPHTLQPHPSPSVRPIVGWTDVLLIGNEMIDADHRQLFAIVDRLRAGINQGCDQGLARDVLAELAAYAALHFAREEALMKETGFPGTEEHRFEHELIAYRLRNLQHQANSGGHGLTGELEIFLDRWLARHIMSSDMQFARSMRGEPADAGAPKTESARPPLGA